MEFSQVMDWLNEKATPQQLNEIITESRSILKSRAGFLRPGDRIEWRDREGHITRSTVVKVNPTRIRCNENTHPKYQGRGMLNIHKSMVIGKVDE